MDQDTIAALRRHHERMREKRMRETKKTGVSSETLAKREAALREKREAAFNGEALKAPPKLAKPWVGDSPMATVDPHEVRLKGIVRVIASILASPVRDEITGIPVVRKLKPVFTGSAGTKAAGTTIGAGRLAADHFIVFAVQWHRKNDKPQTKSEVYNVARGSNPCAQAFKRAGQLAGNGWESCVLMTPEGDAPKTGWGPKDQTFVWPNGMLMRAEERQAFSTFIPQAGLKAKTSKQEKMAMRHLLEICRHAKDGMLANVHIPVLPEDGLVEFRIEFDAGLETPNGVIRWLDQQVKPCSPDYEEITNSETGEVKRVPIPNSGERKRALELALEFATGQGARIHAAKVSWPGGEVSRAEALAEIDERTEGKAQPLSHDEWGYLSYDERAKLARLETPEVSKPTKPHTTSSVDRANWAIMRWGSTCPDRNNKAK